MINNPNAFAEVHILINGEETEISYDTSAIPQKGHEVNLNLQGHFGLFVVTKVRHFIFDIPHSNIRPEEGRIVRTYVRVYLEPIPEEEN